MTSVEVSARKNKEQDAADGRYGTPAPLASHHFGDVSASYEAGRPQVATWVADLVLDHLPERPSVVEVGAGTGQLTHALVGYCGRLVCIEPDDRLRAALTTGLPKGAAEILPQTFEDANLAGVDADLVVASGAWHWLDPTQRVASTWRTLREDGLLALVWNYTDLADSCRAALHRTAFVGRFARFRTTRDRVRIVADRARRDVASSPLFDLVDSRLLGDDADVTVGAYNALLQSYGCAKHLSQEDRDELTVAVEAVLGGAADSVRLRTTTRVDLFRRVPGNRGSVQPSP